LVSGATIIPLLIHELVKAGKVIPETLDWGPEVVLVPNFPKSTSRYDHGIMTMVVQEVFMKKMAAGSFKANCLAVMDEVQAKHETVVITKRGKPVAKLVPLNTETDEIYNFLAGKGTITGDIVSPAISPEEWGELK
jgi:prevent-host-death family protein